MNIYDVKEHGAKGDGFTDDSAAIQNAIDDAVRDKGGTVWFPPGVYLIESTLEVNGLVKLEGTGWNGYNPLDSGSYIFFKNGFNGKAINVTGRASEIENIGVFCEQPNPEEDGEWAPNDYSGNFAINVSVDDVRISNVLLYNLTRGINLDNTEASVGRITLDRIYGRPLKIGIRINRAFDVIRVNNVHFWGFWYGDNTKVGGYLSGNAVGLLSLKNDNPHYSDIFCLGYSKGMEFSENQDGHTSKFRIVNADFDFCGTGIYIDADNTTGQASNVTCQGKNDKPQGIFINGENVKFQSSNLYVCDYAGNGIRVQGGARATFENVWVNNWNISGENFPGIEAAENAKVYLGIGRWFDNANGAEDYGTSGGGEIILSKIEKK